MDQDYPPVGFHFKVEFELEGMTRHDVAFREVSGVTAEIDVETLDEGGENRFSHRLPGRAKYPNLVLKRGVMTQSGLIDWFRRAVENLDIKPATVTVKLLNEQHQPLSTWSVVGAWPVKWSVDTLNAETNGIAVETIEMAYQHFKRVQPMEKKEKK